MSQEYRGDNPGGSSKEGFQDLSRRGKEEQNHLNISSFPHILLIPFCSKVS